MAAEASGGLTSPTPAPHTASPARSAVQPAPGVSPLIKSKRTAIRASPPASRNRTGITVESRPAAGARAKASRDTGSSRRPAWRALYPSTFWRYRVMYRNWENMADEIVNATICAPVNAGILNSLRSTMERGLRAWMARNTPKSTAAPTKNPTMSGLDHPLSFPRSSA